MSGLRGTREFVLRTDSGQSLIGFREAIRPQEPCAMVIKLHEKATEPAAAIVAVSGDAVEEIHALTGQILAGRVVDAHIVCGFRWSDGASRQECALMDGHSIVSPTIDHVSHSGAPHQLPPF